MGTEVAVVILDQRLPLDLVGDIHVVELHLDVEERDNLVWWVVTAGPLALLEHNPQGSHVRSLGEQRRAAGTAGRA